MNEFYIYLHKKADTGEIFYIGKGKGNRAYENRSRNKYWHNVVKKHGYTAEIIADGFNESSAFKYERFKIKELREKGIVLVNMTDGGEGSSGYIPSEETRKKMSESAFGNKNWIGRKHLEETKKKLSEAKRGENNPNFGKTGEKHPSFGRTGEKCANSKPVLQFSKSGEFIKEWPCAAEVERVLKIYHSPISKCCKGKYKSAGGYIWKHKEN